MCLNNIALMSNTGIHKINTKENCMYHDRKSDTKLLIQFAKDQGFDEPDLMEAVVRLEACHNEGLMDYGIPFESIANKKTVKNASKLIEKSTKDRLTVTDYRNDLAFQLKSADDLDWDYFVEIAIKTKIAADKSGENMPEIDRTLNEIIDSAKNS